MRRNGLSKPAALSGFPGADFAHPGLVVGTDPEKEGKK